MKPLLVAGVISLLVHVELAVFMPDIYKAWTTLFPPPKPERVREIDLMKVSRADWEHNRAFSLPGAIQGNLAPGQEDERPSRARKDAAKTPEEQEEIALKHEKEQQKLNGQVVDVAPTPDSSPPKHARFLSEHNTNVEKESVSRHRRKDYGVAQPRPTIGGFHGKQAGDRSESKGRDEVSIVAMKEGLSGGQGGGGERAFEIPDLQKREPLRLKLDLNEGSFSNLPGSDRDVKGNSNRLRLSRGEQGGGAGVEGGDGGRDAETVVKFRKPSLDELALVTGAPANDHIEGVAEGEATLLNTREFRYATFFNRVKRSVSEHWSPGDVYMRYDPYGNVYGVKDRYTVLNVSLDNEGELKDVNVAISCDLDFLDNEAISAFKSASPFPNPPKGLVEQDGLIHFQFGFFFEIGDRPRIRAFRNSPYPY